MALNKEIIKSIKWKIINAIREDSELKNIFDNADHDDLHANFNHEVEKLLNTLFDKSKFIKSYLNKLDIEMKSAQLNSDQLQHFMEKEVCLKIPPIRILIENICYFVKNNYQANLEHAKYVEAIDRNMEPDKTVNEAIKEYINYRYPVKDARTHINDDRRSRRFDSLAKILSLSPKFSVCTSLAVHEGKLFIGMNVSSQKDLEEIAIIISKRMKILNEYLNEVAKYDEKKFSSVEESAKNSLYDALKISGGFTFSREIITQAIEKFTHAVMYDERTFSQELKNVFINDLMNYRLLLPSLNEKLPCTPKILKLNHKQICDGLIMEMKEGEIVTRKFKPETSYIHIKSAEKCSSISDLHAEQLLAYYIFSHKKSTQYNEDNKLNIGISKLCCATCKANLDKLPFVKVRGEHGVLFEKTASLIDRDIKMKHLSTPKKGPTEAIDSPPDSSKRHRAELAGKDEDMPEKKRARVEHDTSTATSTPRLFTSKRRLFDEETEEKKSSSPPPTPSND